MQTQQLLSKLQQSYNFTRANQLLSQQSLKNYWKHWLCCELIPHLCGDKEQVAELEEYYPSAASDTGEKSFLSVKTGANKATASEKRGASKCDFYLPDSQLYVELRCSHQDHLFTGKELDKFKQDMARIHALKQANPGLNIATLFAFFGSFSNSQCEKLAKLDDNQCPSYVLDSGLTGSTSIARLSHIQRNGPVRTCLVACVL